MSWVAWPVGDEDPIEVMGNFVDRVVVGKGRHAGSTTHQTTENVFLHPAVDDGNVNISWVR